MASNGLISARALQYNANHLTRTADNLEVLLDPNGGLSASAAGLAVTLQNPTDFRGIIDPVADGGAAILPTAAGADTTVNNGTQINAGDYYLISTTGTIGGITVNSVPSMLVAEIDNPAADADWSLIQGVDSSLLVPNTRVVNAGAGMTGGGALSADITLDVVAADATITVAADNIKVNPAGLINGGADPIDGDHLDITFTPTNYTPSTAPAEADNANQLAAHLSGIDTAIAGGLKQELFSLTAAQITAEAIVLTGQPSSAAVVKVHWSEGGFMTNGNGVTITGANNQNISWAGAAIVGRVAAGDIFSVIYSS